MLVVKALPANIGDTRGLDLIPGSERSFRVGNRTPLQYSCLPWENSMGRGTWWAIIHGVTKSWTQLSGGLFLLVLQKISWIGDRDYIKSVDCIE